jgi:hypothetical protein
VSRLVLLELDETAAGAARAIGDTLPVMRRRLAVTAAVLAALVGEWVGHSLSYLRVDGLAGLQASLTSGIHDYMIPLGLALLAGGVAGATVWTRTGLALGRRLDRSVALLSRLRRGERLGEPAPGHGAAGRASGRGAAQGPAPSFAARVLALAGPLAAVQCALYLVQENLERALHGLPGGGLSPVLDGYGAAAWIQAAIGLLLATALVAATRLLSVRQSAAELCERIVRALWQRAVRSSSSPQPRRSHVIPAQLLFRNALWCRPPPVPAAA